MVIGQNMAIFAKDEPRTDAGSHVIQFLPVFGNDFVGHSIGAAKIKLQPRRQAIHAAALGTSGLDDHDRWRRLRENRGEGIIHLSQ